MHPLARRFAALFVTLALLGGVWLPFGTSNVVDPDGICGPILALKESVDRLTPSQPPVTQRHCLFCHWRHDMAGAFVSAVVQVALPTDASQFVAGRLTHGPSGVPIDDAAPRGPPAIS